MANTWQNPSIIAKEALIHMKNNCIAGDKVYRGYEQEFMTKSNGWKKGESISIKAPLYTRVKDGSVIDVVDIYEQTTSMTLGYRKHTAHRITGEEMTYNVDAFSERVIKPNVVALANYVDSIIFQQYKSIANQVGTPGVTPGAYLPYALAGARLDDQGVPVDDRYLFIDPTARAYLSDHLKGISAPDVAKGAIQKFYQGNLAGFNTYMSQNIQNHTCGTAAGLTTVLMDATSSEGDTTLLIDTNGSWIVTLTEGDIFETTGCYAVNPVDGKKLGYLRQFVCTAHTDNGNDATIAAYPGTAPYKIYSEAADKQYLPYQTVYGLPTNNNAVNVAGSASLVHPVNMAWHKNAIALAMVPVEEIPTLKTYTANQDGYTIRVSIGGDIINYQAYIRFDILFGIKVLNPFMAVRIAG